MHHISVSHHVSQHPVGALVPLAVHQIQHNRLDTGPDSSAYYHSTRRVPTGTSATVTLTCHVRMHVHHACHALEYRCRPAVPLALPCPGVLPLPNQVSLRRSSPRLQAAPCRRPGHKTRHTLARPRPPAAIQATPRKRSTTTCESEFQARTCSNRRQV